MKKKKNVVGIVLILLMLALPLQPAIPPAPMPGGMPPGGQMPPMTEEEMLRWQQEVDTEIAKFVSTLPPEQQEQFHKDVAELTDVMSKMSDDELAKFIEDVFVPEEGMLPAAPAEEPQPAAPAPQPAQPAKPAVAEKVEDNSKALKLLNNLITRTERFLRKALQIPGISGKIDKWVAKDKVKEWQAGLTWETLKSKVDDLNQKFHTLLESRDPKTKQLRYISDLMKDEALYNNLNKLSTVLTTHEPKIDPAEFGLGTPAKGSHTAVKEILGAFAQAIYTLDVPKELTKLIEKYEPRAKTHREEEDSLRKKAHEDSKRTRTQSPTKTAVSPRVQREMPSTGVESYYQGGSGYSGGGYSGGGYPGGSSRYDYPSESYTPDYSDHGGGGGYEPSRGSGGSRGGNEGAPSKGYIPAGDTTKPSGKPGRGPKADRGEQEPLPGQEGDGKAEGGGKKEKEARAIQEDPEITNLIDNVKDALGKLSDVVEDKDHVKGIAEYILEPKNPIDVDLVTIDMPAVQKHLKKAYEQVLKFKTKLNLLKNPEEFTYYNKRMKVIIANHKDTLKSLASQLADITGKKNIGNMSPANKYAYLNDTQEKTDAVEKLIKSKGKGTPMDLPALSKKFEEWQKITADIK